MKIPLTVLAGIGIANAFAADAPEVSDESLQNYSAWHKMTEQPHPVSIQFSKLCGITPESSAARQHDGPHYGYWINVYMNEPAQIHFGSEKKTTEAFPPGSIVVKEKLHSGISGSPSKAEVGAVAGMIKHGPGYDADTGDWEFFFYYRNKGIERGTKGKLAACADCHHNAPGDYVFGDFAKPATVK